MLIQKEKVDRERFWIECPKCNKKVFGTSEEQLKSSIKIHNAFCKGEKQE